MWPNRLYLLTCAIVIVAVTAYAALTATPIGAATVDVQATALTTVRGK